MAAISSLCVFCGSATGHDPRFAALAGELGTELARRRVRLVYGGGGIGLMGVLADAALAAGGAVTGVIPDDLMQRELGRHGLTELVVVSSMHERKSTMFARADAFAILPGGVGTLDETFEIVTWRQLGLHDKPIVLVNAFGYWRPFLDLLDAMTGAGFISPATRRLVSAVDGVDGLFAELAREEAREIATDLSRL